MQTNKTAGSSSMSLGQLIDLLKMSGNYEKLNIAFLIFIGIVLTPATLWGALMGYKRVYNRVLRKTGEMPVLNDIQTIAIIGMVLGAVTTWCVVGGGVYVLSLYASGFIEDGDYATPIIFFGFNLAISVILFKYFRKWQYRVKKSVDATSRYGSAQFATEQELQPYRKPEGFYVGKDTYYNKPGHLLTVAGTRAGKSINQILQNLLMQRAGGKMNMICIDCKGELSAITANEQRRQGKKVVILNPWDLLNLGNTSFNPLELLKNDRLNLADDCEMIAEAIVPEATGNSSHWNQKARSFISGLILHMVTESPVEERHLGTIWKWLRHDKTDWLLLMAEMKGNDDPNVGEIVQATANEVSSMMTMSDKEFGGVMSTAQKFTDFIKSPALRDSLVSSPDFSADDLASGNVVLYLCIPFDRLKSHNAWLRLVVVSLMRSIIRNPKAETCFLIDEAAAFGYHSEIEMALGAYAGFGIHIWSIFQNLTQIKKIYNDNWEQMIANCSVRSFFGVSDNFSSGYLSTMFGKTSIVEHDQEGEVTGVTARELITIDELRRQSGDTIYTVIDQLPVARIEKLPYYKMSLPADPNPYYKG